MAKVGDSNGSHGVTSEFLYQKWFISTEEDRITVQHTKQRGIRKILHPSLSQQFNTNDRALRYNRMQHSVFADTIQAVTVSSRGNQYAQVYSTNFGWSRSHPMNRKGDAHETLYLFFKIYGVLPNIVMDGSKEQTLGLFRKKFQEEDFHIKQT